LELHPTDFETLQRRLLARVKSCVQNGEVTERGLARMIGISQPHMHHILKGVRSLSVETADRILRKLDISLLDLLCAETPPPVLFRKAMTPAAARTAGKQAATFPSARRWTFESTGTAGSIR
jgi:transcriptional regulator with XRE-family HTH domain